VSPLGILLQEHFCSLPAIAWIIGIGSSLKSVIDDSGRMSRVAVLLRPYGQVKAKRRDALVMSATRGFSLAFRRLWKYAT
jgi:hypothetical protein